MIDKITDICDFWIFIYYLSPYLFNNRECELGKNIIDRIAHICFLNDIITENQKLEVLATKECNYSEETATSSAILVWYIREYGIPRYVDLYIGILDDIIAELEIKEN